VYLRARTYDTRLGRFLSPDPVTLIGGPSNAANPYVYSRNDPLNYVDPLGKLATASIGNFFTGLEDILGLLGTQSKAGCQDCQYPGNVITRHSKCFQLKACLRTRGYFNAAPGALWADPTSLNYLWNTRRPERAAQGFTIAQLNWNREGFWSSLGHLFGAHVQLSPNVDWEVHVPKGQQPRASRFDILTDQSALFEVKRYTGAETVDEVESQIQRYIRTAAQPPCNLRITASTELRAWANAFYVISGYSGFFDIFANLALVYVWGLANLPGHIYFAMARDTNENVKNQVYENHMFSQIPFPALPHWWQQPEPEPIEGEGGGEEGGGGNPFENPFEWPEAA
jgi:hypothetical protein